MNCDITTCTRKTTHWYFKTLNFKSTKSIGEKKLRKKSTWKKNTEKSPKKKYVGKNTGKYGGKVTWLPVTSFPVSGLTSLPVTSLPVAPYRSANDNWAVPIYYYHFIQNSFFSSASNYWLYIFFRYIEIVITTGILRSV